MYLKIFIRFESMLYKASGNKILEISKNIEFQNKSSDHERFVILFMYIIALFYIVHRYQINVWEKFQIALKIQFDHAAKPIASFSINLMYIKTLTKFEFLVNFIVWFRKAFLLHFRVACTLSDGYKTAFDRRRFKIFVQIYFF